MRFWRAALGVGAVIAVMLVLANGATANHNLIQHVSTGPTDPNSAADLFHGALSDDGEVAVFATDQRLVVADTDNSMDVYQYANGVTALVSAGEINGNGSMPANLPCVQKLCRVISADGSRIWFTTAEQLVPEDTDAFSDVYERYQGHTYLVSTGPMNANQPSPSPFQGASPDGTRVYFSTVEPLTVDDTDLCGDIYERAGGVTTLISTGKLDCPNRTQIGMAGYADTVNGSAILFRTSFRMLPQDTDSLFDYYENVGGQIRLLTEGPGTTGVATEPFFKRFSPEGNALLFVTTQRLTLDDTDNRKDAYANIDGVLTRVSKGPAGGNGDMDVVDVDTDNLFGISGAGHSFFFSTGEQLTADDSDSGPGSADLYEYTDGVTRLIGDDATYRGSSADASQIFFETTKQLAPGDTDVFDDVYEDQGGVVTQVSPGNAATRSFLAQTGGTSFSGFPGVSDAGDRVFFYTNDSLVPSDTCCRDLYERFNGTNYLIKTRTGSTGSGALDILTTDGTRLLISSTDRLAATDTDNQSDLYLASVAPNAYARPKAATPLNVAFVPAYQACGAPNRAHAAPLSFGSCNPPVQTSSYLTVGTPDANLQPAKAVGNLRLVVQPGNPATPANEADAYYEINMADVRNKSDLSDYTGALKLDAALQITDKNNPDVDGGSPNATGTQTSFPVAVPCAATPDATVGSTCSITTTANTISPGAVVEGKRAIWEMGQVRVFDGGADGNPGTSDGDGLFLVQGVFIP